MTPGLIERLEKAGGHTPGPWSIHPHHAYVVPQDHIGRPIGGSSDPDTDLATYAQEICAMHWPDPHRSRAEVQANALLIAAAPDLLEAADAMMPLLSLIEDDLWEDCPFPAVQRKRIAALRAAILKARATQEQG